MADLPPTRRALFDRLSARVTNAGAVRIRVEFEETFHRMAVRDGRPADPSAPENHRYLVGQQLYLAACDPESRADVVIDNTEPARPHMVTADTLER